MFFEKELDLDKSSEILRFIYKGENELAIAMRTEIEKCWYIYETHAERNFISDFVGGGFQQRW